jgi:hypothetical protein
MWTISEFPTYGLISGQQTKGYHSCLCCGPFTESKKIRGPNGDKIVYLGMRKRLPHAPFTLKVHEEKEVFDTLWTLHLPLNYTGPIHRRV